MNGDRHVVAHGRLLDRWRPAALVGLRLERGLAVMIAGDVADEPGALPLLSHALLETFERRRGRTLTLSGYSACGGVSGAIAMVMRENGELT